MVRVLARGGFGTVALGTHRASGTQYAIKKVRKALVEKHLAATLKPYGGTLVDGLIERSTFFRA